ncbi:tRNA-methyltransferase subunit [Cavenderia fasciculata]|uniref:tRNA (adenine(58)-N(1))-methyltransferase n=1 Tax=Cavenderia fasciculata TaxID=261658 RepID=F4PHR1_CACFS|nr:tRNA-methyltransferase subunit [Cavenderia fasciculata]EGG25245.1 tRNA-methyltransferase subunit [Cavenderia fasciculata]|eukprot:XP_004363096.1 tRNA-methyltransferase subunit [Cavenderia fasciculata]
MLKSKKIIESGDRVIVYFSKDKMSLIDIKEGQVFNSKFGSFKHNRLIGSEYGSKVNSEDGKGFVHLLHLTPELWSCNLQLRTQILFNTDISTILFNLEVKNGSKVVESGTGSGSLSTSFIRTLAPKGHLYTFEFHEERVKQAQRDFGANGFTDYVTVTHRNVIQNGFKLDDQQNMIGHIDAVFLDLPSPWDAIDHAAQVMREGGMLCSFSPCIEQVQATCLKLDESDFEGKRRKKEKRKDNIKTVEVLIRNYDVRLQEEEILNLYNPYEPNPNAIQTDNNNTNNGDNNNNNNTENTSTNSDNGSTTTVATKQPYKKKRWEKGSSQPFTLGPMEGERKMRQLAKPESEERGHTGYLTFARFMPQEK